MQVDDDDCSMKNAEELLREELYGFNSESAPESPGCTQFQDGDELPSSPKSSYRDNNATSLSTQAQKTEPRNPFYEEEEEETPLRCKQPGLSQQDHEDSAMMYDDEEMESSMCSPQPAMTQKVTNNTVFSENEEELDSPDHPKTQPIPWRPASSDKISDQQYTQFAVKFPENECTATLEEDILSFCASRSAKELSSVAQTPRRGAKIYPIFCTSVQIGFYYYYRDCVKETTL
jgi:hypothetical protein